MKEYDEFKFNRLEERAWEMEKQLEEKFGHKFEVPDAELFCEKCETTNFIYNDMKPPYKCDSCGAELENP